MDILRLGSTAWLVHDGQQGILIDSGKQTNANSIKRVIKRLRITLPLIFLTHTHYDHSRGAEAVRRATGAKVIVGASEADFLRQGYTPVPKGTNDVSRLLGNAAHTIGSKTHEHYTPVNESIIEVSSAIPLDEYGFDANILLLGAHTSGSIGLVIDGHAFVGDTVFNMGGIIYPLFADIPEEIPAAWEKIITSGALYICPGHGGMIPRDVLAHKYQQMYK